MITHFPPEYRMLLTTPGVKAAWVSENTSNHPDACMNCGGVGKIFLFLATAGPFNEPGNIGQISHYADGKWWIGSTKEMLCPECNSNKPAHKDYTDRD